MQKRALFPIPLSIFHSSYQFYISALNGVVVAVVVALWVECMISHPGIVDLFTLTVANRYEHLCKV